MNSIRHYRTNASNNYLCCMIKATINGESTLTLETQQGGQVAINGKVFPADIKHINGGTYHLILNDKSYNVEVIISDTKTKKHTLKINGKILEVELKDRFDELLKELGIDAAAGQKIGDLKAPMPGLVVDIPVTEGQEVKKGDTLVILEAMKMENALKAMADAVVKKIVVKKGQAVEKNELLIQMA